MFFLPFKSASSTFFSKIKTFYSYFYFIVISMLCYIFERWFRLLFFFFVGLFWCYLKIVNITLAEFMTKTLPKKFLDYIHSKSDSDRMLEQHFDQNTPLVKAIKTATYIFGGLLLFTNSSYPLQIFLGLSPILMSCLLDTFLILMVYITLFTLYLIWCTNAPEVFPFTKTFKSLGVLFIAGLGVEHQNSLDKDTVRKSYLPPMFKYVSQDIRQTPYILGDRYDYAIEPVVEAFTARYPGVAFAYDPNFPLRLDYRAYLAADVAYKNGASESDVKAILFRNSHLASKSRYHTTPRLSLLLEAVPERSDLLATDEELAEEARVKKPYTFKSVIVNPSFIPSKSNIPVYVNEVVTPLKQEEVIRKFIEKKDL
jgi:hypothetical protein